MYNIFLKLLLIAIGGLASTRPRDIGKEELAFMR
jgi:hypothetical protein